MLCLYVKYNSVLGLGDHKQICHSHKCLVGRLNVGRDMEQFLFLVNGLHILKHPASPLPKCLCSGVMFEIFNN